MKICIINNLYKPYAVGGAERVIETITNGLKNAGHRVVLVTTMPILKRSNNSESNPKIYRIRSLNFIFRKMPKVIRLIWHITENFNLISYFKIKAIIKKEKPELVITHNLVGIGLLIPVLIKNLKITHIHTLHDIQLLHPSGLMIYGREGVVNKLSAKAYQMLTKRLFKKIPIIISPSKWLMDEHLKRNFFKDSKQMVIPNPTELSPVKTSSLKNKKTIFRLLYTGQIEEHKGINFLINTFFGLIEKYGHNYELVLAGDGSLLNYYKGLIKEKNNKDIKFLGKVEHEQIYKLMKESDILVVPSLCYENSPTVIYEAFIAGLPVIASRVGGIGELVRKFGGILFTPDNADDFIKKINWAQKNPVLLADIAKKGIINIHEYNVDNYINKLLSLKTR